MPAAAALAVVCLLVGLCHQPRFAAAQLLNPQLTANYTPSDVAELNCIALSLRTVAKLCQANSSSLGDELTRLLRNCLSAEAAATPTQQPARLLMIDNPFVDIMENATKVYEDLTGIPIQVAAPPYVNVVQSRTQSINNASNINATHEAWLVSPGYIADGVLRGAFRDLSSLVQLDSRLLWQGIIEQVRASALLYKSQVVTLPLSSFVPLLLYRKDMFDKYNISVPRTWRELNNTIHKYNGTEDLYSFCVEWDPCLSAGLALVRNMLGTVLQTHGATQGWFIDADSLGNTSSPRYSQMGLLMDSPAAVEVFELMRVLHRWSAPTNLLQQGCPLNATNFLRMRCLMTLDWPASFKYVSYMGHQHPLAGNLGAALLPGSERVLDRETNQMVPCDPVRCPYATRYTNEDGTSLLVNHSPGFDAGLLALNAHTEPELGFYTYRVASYLTSPDVTDLMVFHPTAQIFPSRVSQLHPQRWADAGFNLQDAQRFCRHQLRGLAHENINQQVRLPFNLIPYFANMANNITFTNRSITEIAAAMQRDAIQILNGRYQGNMTALQEDYFASLNRQFLQNASSTVDPPNATTAAAAASAASAVPRGSPSLKVVVPSVVLPVLAAAALLGLVLYYRRYGGRGRWWQPLSHPLPGPMTTLLVTDIENSTPLWEQLPEGVMNAAMVLHDACVRRLAAEHKGYESLWEGDSFVIAFHSPRPALDFALALQLALLQKPWSAALVAHPMAQEVWFKSNATSPPQPRLRSVMPALQQLASSITQGGLGSGETSKRPRSGGSLSAASPTQAQMSYRHAQSSASQLHGVQQLHDDSPASPDNSHSLARLQGDAIVSISLSPLLPGASGVLITRGGSGGGDSDCSGSLWPPQQELRQSSNSTSSSTTTMASSSGSGGLPSSPMPRAFSLPLPSFTSPNQSSQRVSRSSRGSDAQGAAQQAAAAAADSIIHAQGGSTTPWTTWQQTVAGSWQRCAAGTPGAVLTHRGLRVRVGLSLGSATLSYNKLQGRWRYSGPIRALSNAVANAAHGGQIMLSSQTATALAGLPNDCWTLYMGSYILSDVGPEPVHLVMVQPTQLKARLATCFTPLRAHMCCLHGVLHAPSPSPTTKPGLAYVQASNISTLMAWQQQATLQAVQQLHECMQQQANMWDGFIFEDGVLRMMYEHAASSSQQHPASGESHSHRRSEQHSRDIRRLSSASSQPASPASSTIATMSAGHRSIAARSSNSSTTAGAPGSSLTAMRARSSGSSKPSSSSSSPVLGVAFPDELRALKFAVSLRLELLRLRWPEQLLEHELCEPLGYSGVAALAEQQQVLSYAPPSDADTAAVAIPEIVVGTQEEEGEVQAGQQGVGPQPQGPLLPPHAHASNSDGAGFEARPTSSASVQVRPAPKARGVSGTWYELDAPMLRGLRTRTVLLGEVQDVQPCMRTRGYVRAAYTAKHGKHVPQLFKLAKQGQILASAHVVAAAGWFMPAIPE